MYSTSGHIQTGLAILNPRAQLIFRRSGFIIPSLTSDADFCAALARAGTTVFDADYRKAPEHPFPAAVHDAEDVLSYVRAQSSDFDTRHLTIGGFSAGANIAMSVAVNSPPGSVAGLVSVYGNTDMTRAYPTPETEYDGGMVLPGWLRWFFYKCLILPGQDKADRRLSPAYAPIERWPKHVYFACGAADSLHGAGKAMAEKLNAEGHMDVDFFSVGHAAHAFDKRVKEGSRSEKGRDETYQQAIEMIERAHTDG